MGGVKAFVQQDRCPGLGAAPEDGLAADVIERQAGQPEVARAQRQRWFAALAAVSRLCLVSCTALGLPSLPLVLMIRAVSAAGGALLGNALWSTGQNGRFFRLQA